MGKGRVIVLPHERNASYHRVRFEQRAASLCAIPYGLAKEKTIGRRRLSAIPKAPFSKLFILLAMAIEAAFHAQLPFSAGLIVDRVLVSKDRDALAPILSILLGGFLAALLAGLLRDSLLARLQSRAVAGIRQSMFERLQQLSQAFHEKTANEEVMECFGQDIGVVESAFAMVANWGVLPAIEAVLFTGTILWLDWRVGLVSLLLWPWTILAQNAFTRHVANASDKCRDEEVRMLGIVEESLTARLVIRAFSLEHLGIGLFRKRGDLLRKGLRRTGFLMASMDRFTQTGILFLQIAILTLSALLAFDDRMTAGKLVSIPILSYMLAQSLLRVAEYAPALKDGRAAWRRIRLLLRDPSPVLDKADAKQLPPLQNEILFNDVSFAYGETTALDNVTARVKKGSYTAFVGPSGSGKSTMMKLLMRFHDPSSGRVTIDGHDLKAVTQASLRSRIGVVLQENFIFSASVLENVRLANPAATEEKLKDLVQACGIAAAAADLPQGLDTPVGENGSRVSGELMQRIALARALLRNPDIVLLDEVASALDAVGETAINQTLRALAKDRTVISVTHRLSSAADADLIYVFDEGRIVEQGSHFELIAASGFYAKLWHKQAGFHFSADGSHVDVDAQKLKQLPILEKVDTEILAELAPYFTTATWLAGREIVHQNDPGDQFYIIVRGRVEVWRNDESTGEHTCMAVLQDGDYFGEITLITGFPRTATVRTTTVCTCISIGRGQFERLIDKYPDLRRELSETAKQRMLESTGAIR